MLVWLSAAYLLSGFCALVYETVWIYQFSRVFGSTVLATSFVVAAFFAGLALGGKHFGKAASKSANPLRLYALLELGVGVYALIFPLLITCIDGLYGAAYPHLGANMLALLRLLLSALLLLPPTLLMGGTLPVLLAHCADGLDTLGRRAGLVYGINALGAALGSLLTGYVLLKLLGTSRTNALAAVINLAVGALALVLSRRKRAPVLTSENAAQTTSVLEESLPRGRADLSLIIVAFAVSGFVSMAYEVVWLRYLVFYFQETLHVYSGIITVFILGIAAGSLLCGRFVARLRHPVAFLGILQLGIGLSTFAAIHLPIEHLRTLYNAGRASDLNVLPYLLALLFLPALFMGATFPVVTRIIVGDLRALGAVVGRAYAWNTAGGVLGLLTSGFVLQRFLGLQVTLYFLLGLNLLLAAVLLQADRKLRKPYLSAVPVVSLVAAILLVRFHHLELPEALMRQMRAKNEEVLAVREGLLGVTWASCGRNTREVHLWSNGVRISRGGRSTFLAQGFIPMLLAPQIPRDVLGLAFGAGLSYRGARLFTEVRRMDFVDLSRDNIEVALQNFPENRGLAADPRAHFIIDDAYSFVKYTSARYDLILMEPTPPRFCYQTAALYTKEFYAYTRQRLNPAGFFAQVLPLEDFSPAETTGVMHTFAAVFPHVLLWRNGWDCLMIGSVQPFKLNEPEIAARLSRPEIQQALRASAPIVDNFSVLDNFLSGLLLVDGDFRAAAAAGPLFTDDNAGLRFTTGRDVSAGNIANLHRHLTPWPEARRLFVSFPDFAARQAQLLRKREYFMALLYSVDPPRFIDAFLAYIKNYSGKKDEDLNTLIDFMTAHGITENAAVLDYIQALDNAPSKAQKSR